MPLSEAIDVENVVRIIGNVDNELVRRLRTSEDSRVAGFPVSIDPSPTAPGSGLKLDIVTLEQVA